MKLNYCLLWIASGITLCYLAFPSSTHAQIIPDATLPVNSSVTPDGNTSIITGGTKAGSNLFHSFEKFSIPTGSAAYFNNALDIQNIIGRVTGGSISNIDGLIKANSTANLFLLNPNGVIFGPNARLDINGSFLASTASSLNFADGTQFSATTPQTKPLLTVSVPIGLGFGSNPGPIRVQGTGHSLLNLGGFFPIRRGDSSNGLRVQPGKTLALVGGSLALKGGVLTAQGGQIELGSVDNGVVSLKPNTSGWILEYQKVPTFRNIQLSQQALVDVSGASSGSVGIQGGLISLSEGSVILNQNQGIQPSGSISVNASDSLELKEISPNAKIASSLVAETLGIGQGADIFISTKKLIVQNGGQIVAQTFNGVAGGNLTINASESVQILGFSIFNPQFFSNIATATFGSGGAGSINLNTGSLKAKDGGSLGSATFGSGKGGDVTVNATEFVELSGLEPTFFVQTAIGAPAYSSGDAGSITIYTSRLALQDGGRITSSTGASGKAGSVTIKASDSIEVSGIVPGSVNPSLIDSSANIANLAYRQVFKLPPKPSGDAGSLTLNTRRLSVTDGGLVSVNSDGSGNAGTLRVEADFISLDSLGSITAATASGEGGNIFLQAQNLLLRHNSKISAEAGGTGNGGNITIGTGTLAALENSDVTADAVRGRGGNIRISTQGLFRSPDSDITASSQLGIDGVVEIRTLGFDATNALTPFADNFVTTEQVMANSCLARRNAERGSFVVTGSGGLPLNPYSGMSEWELLTQPVANVPESPSRSQRQPTSNQVATNRIPVAQVDAQRSQHNPTSNQETAAVQPSEQPSDSNEIVIVRPEKKWKLGDPIVEAQGLVVTADGRTLAIADRQATPETAESVVCHQS